MKLAIIGSRNWHSPEMVQSYIQTLPKDTVIISGHAQGVDRMAETFAREAGLEVISLPADWTTYGNKAGVVRNSKIVNFCDKLVAFWDGVSKGTKDSIKKAMLQNKLDRVIVAAREGERLDDLASTFLLAPPSLTADGRIPPKQQVRDSPLYTYSQRDA